MITPIPTRLAVCSHRAIILAALAAEFAEKDGEAIFMLAVALGSYIKRAGDRSKEENRDLIKTIVLQAILDAYDGEDLLSGDDS